MKHTPPAIHLGFKGDRNTAKYRAYTIAEHPPFPLVQTNNVEVQSKQYKDVIEWLEVDKADRWLPVDGKTYCNIYSTDIVYLLGGYLPRVFWYPKVVAKGAPYPAIEYAKTVYEVGANGLHDWLLEYGSLYGWVIVDHGRKVNANELRVMLNARNTYGLIASKRIGGKGSGHITVCFPDNVHTVEGDGPLQTQAGTYNKRWFKDNKWYLSSRFESTVIAYYNGV